MNKRISIIVVVVAILALTYWLSTADSANYTGSNEAQNPESIPAESEPEINVTVKGPLGIASGSAGQYLVDKDGLTLYLNGKDAQQKTENLKATCNAECEKIWPPYLVGDTDPGLTETSDPLLSKLNVLVRADGSKQYALGNQPLYRYSGDTKLGDMTGNVSGDWMVAKP